MNDLDLLRPMAVFAEVVDQGSFRGAAEKLSLSPPYVSQMISDLEARLGVQLLYRSTRRIALTEPGEAFVVHARTMAAAFRDGIAGGTRALSGRLRISAPSVAAAPFFARVLGDFAREHPGVTVDLSLDDAVIDPIAARIDLAIRIGHPGDDPRLARKLFETRGVVCCGPGQLEGVSAPGDLRDYLWLRSPTMGASLTLFKGAKRVAVTPSRQMIVNSAAMIRAALDEAEGYAIFPDFAVRDALEQGLMRNPLPDHATEPVPVYALYTERRTELTTARAFVEMLVKRLKGLSVAD